MRVSFHLALFLYFLIISMIPFLNGNHGQFQAEQPSELVPFKRPLTFPSIAPPMNYALTRCESGAVLQYKQQPQPTTASHRQPAQRPIK